MSKHAWILALFLGQTLFADDPPSPPPPDSRPVKRAVLIGIDSYRNKSIPAVPGALNDIALMQDLLVGKFAFDPKDIVPLKNEQAKHDAIFQTIRTHLGGLKSGDLALVHFAGHGSQKDDQDGDEIHDHLDETIVPWDARQNSIHDITDDAMNGLMRELSANGAMVVFILDSCHSGSGLRGFGRWIPPERAGRQRRIGQRSRGLQARETHFHQSSSRYVLVSACAPTQLAGEFTVRGVTYGYLTYYMTEILRSEAAPITYHELLQKLRESEMSIRTSQNPDVEGTSLDAVVFGTTTILRRPTVIVEPEGEDASRAKIAAGKAHGVDTGTSVKVFPPQTTDFTRPPIASVRITDAFSDSSRGVVESGQLVPHSRGIIDLLQRPHAPLRVSIAGLPSPLRTSVAQALSAHESIRVVAAAPFDIAAEPNNGTVVLRRSDGEILREVPASATSSLAACTATALLNCGRWFALLALDNPGSALDVDLSVRKADDQSGPEIDTAKEGDRLTIVVTNKSLVPVFVVLLDLAPACLVEVLNPEVTVDGIGEGSTWPSPVITAYLPPGRSTTLDHIKAIITTRKISPDVFRLLDECQQGEARKDEDDLHRFLRLSTHGVRTPPMLIDAWGVRSRNFRVEGATP